MRKIISALADIAVVAVAVGVLWGWYSNWTRPKLSQGPVAGTVLNNLGVDWKSSGHTVALVLNRTCHFCSESAPFYQRLVREVSDDAPLVAIFPHDVASGQSYLDSLGIRTSRVYGPITLPWLMSTPTIMVIDRQGKLEKAWVGRLGPQQETEVLTFTKGLGKRSASAVSGGSLSDGLGGLSPSARF